MHDQQPGTSAFTAVGAPQLNTVTNLPEVRPLVHPHLAVRSSPEACTHGITRCRHDCE